MSEKEAASSDPALVDRAERKVSTFSSPEEGDHSWPDIDRRQPTFWSWMRHTARLWGFLAFILIIVILFRAVILPFILAGLVAYILIPLLRWLCWIHVGRFKPPRFVWIILLYAVLLGLQVFFLTSFVPRVSKDFMRVVQEVPAFWEKAHSRWVPSLAGWLQKNLGEPTSTLKRVTSDPPPSAPKIRLRPLPGGEMELDTQGLHLEIVHQSEGTWLIRTPLPAGPQRPSGQRVAGAIVRYVNEAVQRSEMQINRVIQLGQVFLVGIFNTITTFILVLMISAFLLADTDRILRAMRNLVPRYYYRDFDNVIRLMDKGLSGAIRGQLLVCLINAVLTWIGLTIFGVKYPFLMALLAGVMSLIPIFGSILSSIPIVIVALVSTDHGVDVVKGLLILLWIIGIHLLEANFLNPKIIGSAARIHPIIVIFAVVAGERTYGPIGALLGVPLVSAVQAIFIYLRQRVRGEVDTDPKSASASTGV